MSKRRSSLAELERLLRASDYNGNNLRQHLIAHGDALAEMLRVDASELHALETLPEHDIASRLKSMLANRAEENAKRHEAAVRQASRSAAERLASTARWGRRSVALDAALVFGDLLLDTSRMHIIFRVPGSIELGLPRSRLVEVAKAMKPYGQGVMIWLDETAFRVRWRQGRGGLNLLSQTIPASESSLALVVTIPPRTVEVPEPAPPVKTARRPPAPRANSGGLFSDILTALFS